VDECREIKKLDHETLALHVVFTRDKKYVLTSGEYVLVWSIRTLDTLHKIEDGVYFTQVSLSFDALYFAVGTKNSFFSIYACSNWKEVKKILIDGENKEEDEKKKNLTD
jgi:hypothetical protein